MGKDRPAITSITAIHRDPSIWVYLTLGAILLIGVEYPQYLMRQHYTRNHLKSLHNPATLGN